MHYIKEVAIMLSINDIKEARSRIAPYILATPLLRVPALDPILGAQIYIKPECFQFTGSFKLRGATNKLLSLTERERAAGVIAASSGNHAQAVACAAQRLGVKALIVVPEDINPLKAAGVRSFGAELLPCGLLSSQRVAKMKELCVSEGYTAAPPFDDHFIRAGQGTLGLEIMEAEPHMDMVICPVGGGGLISGTATAVKESNPKTKVVGAEPAQARRYAASRAAGQPTTIETGFTIADGTRTNDAAPANFAIIEHYVDELVGPDDQTLRQAMQLLIMKAKLIAEPSSCLPAAALLAGLVKVQPSDKVCLVVSGGNADPKLVAEVLSVEF